MASRTSTAGTLLSTDTVGFAQFNDLPGGWIGYFEITANQTGVTTVVDLTGLAGAVTVGTSRRIRIHVYTGSWTSTSGSAVSEVALKEGATQLQIGRSFADVTSVAANSSEAVVILTPSAGAHTYKATFEQISGAGSSTFSAAATRPAFLLIEDLGPA